MQSFYFNVKRNKIRHASVNIKYWCSKTRVASVCKSAFTLDLNIRLAILCALRKELADIHIGHSILIFRAFLASPSLIHIRQCLSIDVSKPKIFPGPSQ